MGSPLLESSAARYLCINVDAFCVVENVVPLNNYCISFILMSIKGLLEGRFGLAALNKRIVYRSRYKNIEVTLFQVRIMVPITYELVKDNYCSIIFYQLSQI